MHGGRPEHDNNDDDGDGKDNSNGDEDNPDRSASHVAAGAMIIPHRPGCMKIVP